MSVDTNLRLIQCDSRDCAESLAVPILPVDGSKADLSARRRSAATGWVFVASTYEDRHYCPTCAEKVLPRRAA